MVSLHFRLKRIIKKGFILPFTMLIVTLILLVVTTASNTLSKQLFFSKTYRASQLAYYAADDAMMCALAVDDAYKGTHGYGIFPGGISGDPITYIDDVINDVNAERLLNGLTTITKEEIECAQVAIFDVTQTGFEVSSVDYEYEGPSGTETGKTTTFLMRIPITNDTFRCALVTINRTATFRQIIAQGYSSCTPSSDTVERAVVNTTIFE